MTNKENKTIDLTKKVKIYWNLNKSCWSIKQGNRVAGYANNILLKDCKFTVSEKGRLRVVSQQRKNVHAFVEGFISELNLDLRPPRFKTKISYDPYRRKTFYYIDSKKGIGSAEKFGELYLGEKVVYESYTKK